MEDLEKDLKVNIPILIYLLPLTWFIYLFWRIGLLERDYQGVYRSDPNIFFIDRLVFQFKPICGKTKKGTKFCGNWHWFNLIFWEIHLLIWRKRSKSKSNYISFP